MHVDVYRINQLILTLINNAIWKLTWKNINESGGTVTISFNVVNTDLSFYATDYNSDVIGVLQIQVNLLFCYLSLIVSIAKIFFDRLMMVSKVIIQ